MWITFIGEILSVILIIILIRVGFHENKLEATIDRLERDNEQYREHYDKRDLMKLPKKDNFCMACGTSVK